MNQYPALYYPELYILKGGYRDFFPEYMVKDGAHGATGEPKLGEAYFSMQLPGPAKPSEKKLLLLLSHYLQHLYYT